MNKEFKIGQRVWSKTFKDFAIVIDNSYELTSKIKFDNFDNNEDYSITVFNIHLHQTADDMFEELGYNPYTLCLNDDLVGYQWHDKDFNDHTIRNIMFYKDKTWNIFQDNICKAIVFDRPTIKEHQAIHQKLIELGWIE